MLQLALLPAALLAAQEPALERITVTAARQPQPLGESLVAVEVIDRAAITRSQARDVLELLRSHTGIDLARTGGPGQTTSVFMRGSNSNHVLVLIDGVRVASSTTGAYTFEQLPLTHIERIEIVRGPRAALYGSDAIGGVIHVQTRSGVGTHALLSYGSDRDGEVAVGHGIGDDQSSLYLSASRRDRRGFSAQNEAGFSFDPDDDGFESTRVGVHGKHRFNERVQGQLSLLGIDSDIEFDQGETTMDDRSVALRIEHSASAQWSQQLQLGYARQKLATPVFDQRFQSEHQQLDWLHQYQLNDQHQLGFGVNLLRDKGENAALDGQRFYGGSRDSHGAFVRYAGQLQPLQLEASARYDHYDGFGSELTGQLGIGHQFETGKVYLSVGEGFRAPNLNELYSPGFGGLFAGNPLLDPERSRTVELGGQLELPLGTLEAQVYRSRIRDLIAFQGGNVFQAVNVQRAEIDGAELGWRLQGSGWDARLSATWTDPVNAVTGQQLLRRAKRKFGVEADHALTERWSVGGEVSHSGPRSDVGGVQLGSYTLLSLRTAYALGNGWSIEARGENLGDKDYELARGFNTADRGFQLSLRYGD